MSDSPSDDIPTLDKIVFPGRAEAEEVARKKAALVDPVLNFEPKKSPEPDSSSVRLSFDQELSRHIDQILARHMEAARKEIVQVVMKDLRARIPDKRNKD